MEGFFTSAELESFPATARTGELLPKCGACGLFRDCKSPKMEPEGSGRLRVLVVGESPGYEEDQDGRPFAGPSGQLLREAISQAGYDYGELTLTNAFICHPVQKHKLTKKRRELEWCRPNLMRTIEQSNPRVIITLGRPPLESMLQSHWRDDVGVLERWTGATIPIGGKYWICPTWNPAYLLREPNAVRERMFQEHLETALAIRQTPPPLPDFSTRIEKLYSEREIVAAIRSFDEAGGSIAFDYETNCLKPEYPKAQIHSCAISNGRRTIAYPWWGQAITATSVLLRSSRTRKLAANMKFEERWTLKHLDHPVSGWNWDTMLGTHAVDNRTAVCSLKFQAFIQLGVPSYNNRVEAYLTTASGSHYNRIHDLDLPVLLQYNGMDALLEWHLARKQQLDFGGSYHIWKRKTVESSPQGSQSLKTDAATKGRRL